MKISIVTATYNSGKTLRDTLESIKNQTYQDYEIVIQDGGSKDNTYDIVKEYAAILGDRLRWFQEEDEGLYDAMNRGISHATGEVVGILNSDDLYWDNKVLETIAKTFSKDAELQCLYGNLVYVNAHDIRKIERQWIGSQYKKGMFCNGWSPAHPTFYAKRDCFETCGAFKTKYEISADFELMLNFLEKHSLKSLYIPRYMVRMRQGGKSNGSLRNIIIGNRNIRRALRDNGYKVTLFYTFRRLVPKVLHMAFIKVKQQLGLGEVYIDSIK